MANNSSPEKNIGLFGGTFSPPHLGHLSLAKDALSEFNLDRIFFIPAYIPPHKEPRNVMDAEHRMEMVKLLIEGEPGLILSDFEINRKSVSYTIDTVRHFKSGMPQAKFHFLIGSDAFFHMETWKNYNELINLIDFIVFPRAGFTKEMIAKKYSGAANVVFWAHTGLIRISSTDIRFRLRSGEDCSAELGSRVSGYINEKGLYR
ncbi:MAG: nicotinate-nucleotide adenylyltransferase [Spirochaetia bacterium]|nr:nicotinate-nucleotide adenylyltransferase [Spirochaetia bacterium]